MGWNAGNRAGDRKTGNLRAVQLLLGHTRMDRTVRYLRVELKTLWPSPKLSKSENPGPFCTDGLQETFAADSYAAVQPAIPAVRRAR